MPIPPVQTARGKKAAAIRYHRDPTHPLRVETARDLAAANIKAAIDKYLADAPALTRAQIDELAWLLRKGGHR